MSAMVHDLESYRRRTVEEVSGDGLGGSTPMDMWWRVYDECVENIGLMPTGMVLKLMTVCRGRLRDGGQGWR